MKVKIRRSGLLLERQRASKQIIVPTNTNSNSIARATPPLNSATGLAVAITTVREIKQIATTPRESHWPRSLWSRPVLTGRFTPATRLWRACTPSLTTTPING